MIWFFSREESLLRIETRYDNDSAEYVLVVHWPDGIRQTERFRDEAGFRSRLVELQAVIDEAGWLSSGAPHITGDGWRDRIRH